MRQILTAKNPILREKSKSIKKITSEVKAIAEEMLEMLGMKHYGEVPLAIAAPQVGELIRMFVYRRSSYSAVPDDVLVVINPELVYTKGNIILKETCLSLPGKEFWIKRHNIVKLRGLDLNEKQCSFKGRGLIAQVLEHEIDHLDGILIDKIGIPTPH